MEHLYEEAVMWYVTAGGQRFVCPQFLIHDETWKKWNSCPDFVAIDFVTKTIYIIEVTVTSDVSDIVKKICSNAAELIVRLKGNLKNKNVDFEDWEVKFRVFIRKAELEHFKRRLVSVDGLDIKPIDLEQILVNWEWWDRAGGPVNSLDGI